MKRTSPAIILLLAMILATSCSQPETADIEPKLDAEEAFKLANQQLEKAETNQEKAEICKLFIQQYPNSEDLPNAVDGLTYFQGTLGGEMAAALQVVEEIRPQVIDIAIANRVDLMLCQKYAELGDLEKFNSTAAMLLQQELNFGICFQLMEPAALVEDWDTLNTLADKALPFANAEAFAAQYPDDNFSPERIAAAGKSRLGIVTAYKGWARANIGETVKALEDFDLAETLLSRDSMGQPAWVPLDYYRGKTQVLRGDMVSAIPFIAKAAIRQSNSFAVEELKSLYALENDDLAGFDDFLSGEISKVSMPIIDFDLPGYDGEQHSLADLGGDKATLIVFWHPT